jgi:hypothetical protein
VAEPKSPSPTRQRKQLRIEVVDKVEVPEPPQNEAKAASASPNVKSALRKAPTLRQKLQVSTEHRPIGIKFNDSINKLLIKPPKTFLKPCCQTVKNLHKEKRCLTPPESPQEPKNGCALTMQDFQELLESYEDDEEMRRTYPSLKHVLALKYK